MTKNEEIQFIKSTAFNKIRRMFHPLSKWKGDPYDDDSYIAQKGYEVNHIMEIMEKDITECKNKHKLLTHGKEETPTL